MKRYDLVVEPGREEHLARDHVTVEEVGDVLAADHSIRRVIQGYLRLVRQTNADKRLTIFLGHRGGRVYGLVTARDGTTAERRAASGLQEVIRQL